MVSVDIDFIYIRLVETFEIFVFGELLERRVVKVTGGNTFICSMGEVMIVVVRLDVIIRPF